MRPFTDLLSSLSVQLFPPCYSVLKALAACVPLDSHLSSQLRVHQALNRWPGNSLKSRSWDNHRAYFIFPCLLMVTVLQCLIVSVLPTVISYIFLFLSCCCQGVNLTLYSILNRRQSPIIYLKNIFQTILLLSNTRLNNNFCVDFT